MKPLQRFIASAVALIAAVGGSAVATVTPAHAATYLSLKNAHSGTCLTGGKVQSAGAGSAFVSSCSGSWYQQWYWSDGDAYGHTLRNRASGLCLRTDFVNDVNAVWTSPCDDRVAGELWAYDPDYKDVTDSDFISFLRTSPTVGAVYTDKSARSFATSYYTWDLHWLS
jgi:hypothetical protein